MKKYLPHTQLRLVTWYIGLCILGFSTVESGCSCRNHDINDHVPPTPSLEFAKLSYDRSNKRLVVTIKNTGKETAKDLSLRCTNISQNEQSRTAIRFNNTPITTIFSIPDLAAGASAQEIYIDIDFQTAKEALVQMKVISGQQEIKTGTIQVNLFPIDLLPTEPIVIVQPGKMGELKWKLVTDEQVDFTAISLNFYKIQGSDIDVSIEGTKISLSKSMDIVIITGADLEKLAKQKEILLKVKNNTTETELIGCTILDRGKEIARICNVLVSGIEAALVPATIHGNIKLVKQAIAEGADVNTKNIEYKPALHLAAERGHQEIVQILLKNGADINATDNDGNTALHVAASKGYKAIAKLLLQYRAKKNIKNNNGEIAADLAKDQEIKDLINNWKN